MINIRPNRCERGVTMKRKAKYTVTALLLAVCLVFFELAYPDKTTAQSAIEAAADTEGYIRYIDFTPTQKALEYAAKLDIETHGDIRHIRMYELLAVYSANTGGSYKNYKNNSLDAIQKRYADGEELIAMVKNETLLNYYLTAYEAVLGSFVGEYTELDADGKLCSDKKYGIRVFSPIAKDHYYSHYDDFGASRSFGYKRSHLGHDMLGSIGTPIIAVESGYVEACGWNTYGGWRIGIRSFDGKRYYYYAHLRRDHPYNDIYEGKIINAGEVIGYLGMTGYSQKENTNNISTPHLHFGMQVIFDKSQKDGNNQIWIDLYQITTFLEKYRSSVKRKDKEYVSKCTYFYPCEPD